MTELITVEIIGPQLALVTLNRPERRNALCIELLEALCDQIEHMAARKTARVLILRGAGSVFSSGLDLAEASNADLVHRSAESVSRALQLLRNTPLITIAAAHGGAWAGGAGLMAACDIVIGSSDLKIAFPEARRGLLPALICAVLSLKVREGDLRELFLVGDVIDAARAQQIGLLQHVVEPDRLLDHARRIAESVLAGGPETIVATKMLLNDAYQPTQATSLQHMLQVHLGARHSPEASEGLAAFLQKRNPSWAGSDGE
ncbi:MAG: enoyl-CoA hydratase/isomerase family protein [Planctomycetaceae bacterium]|nr:enoyl-CoA hydratase/isomerase family protein [Planctomycetaceae bacterium]